MIALGMVVGQLLLDYLVKRSFAEHEPAIEGFALMDQTYRQPEQLQWGGDGQIVNYTGSLSSYAKHEAPWRDH